MQLAERVLVPGSEHGAELVDNIKLKRALLGADDPAHERIKTALIIGGGAMQGAFSGGVVSGLEKLGMTEVFDDVVGISVGASSAAYFLARQAALGTTLFSEELATGNNFIDLSRLPPWRSGNPLNLDYLRKIFTTGSKVLDQAAIRANRSRFHVGVTNIMEAQPQYIEVAHDEGKDIIRYIQASSAVPGFTAPISIDGTLYGDGITTCKNPIGFGVEELGATDIVCVLNRPLRHNGRSMGLLGVMMVDRARSAYQTKGYSPAIREAFRDRHAMSDEAAATKYSPNLRIGIICPPEKTVSQLSKDSPRLRNLAQQAMKQTEDLFA